MSGQITKEDVIDAINELVGELAAFEDANDCEVEFVLEADGTASLRQSGDDGDSFDEVARFESMEGLWNYIVGAPEVADVPA